MMIWAGILMLIAAVLGLIYEFLDIFCNKISFEILRKYDIIFDIGCACALMGCALIII